MPLSPASSVPSGTVLFRVVAERAGKAPSGEAEPLVFTVVDLALSGPPEVVLVRGRALELHLDRAAGTTFLLTAPIGTYRTLRVVVRGPFAKENLSASFPVQLAVTATERAELELALDTHALTQGGVVDLGKAVRVSVAPPEALAKSTMPPRGSTSLALPLEMTPGSFAGSGRRTTTGRMPAMPVMGTAEVRLDILEGALAPGSDIHLRVTQPMTPPAGAVAPAGLPDLFRGQRVMGPIVEVTASATLSAPIALTLPFDEMAVAAVGLDPGDLVVLQLDDRRTLYTELRPRRIDRMLHTVTVDAGSLSSFFPCSPGIEISAPRLRRDAAGGATAWSSAAQATIAGRIADDRARASIHDAPSGRPLPSSGGWQAQGWFDFEGVALRPRLSFVKVRGEVEGLVAHECSFAIRANPPPKRVTDPSRHYGPRLAVGDDDIPLVTAVIPQNRFTSDDLIPPFAEWQRNLSRYGPYIYRPTADSGSWEWRGLLPELHFEEGAATIAVGMLRALMPVPTPPGAGEDRHSLQSLAALLSGVSPDAPLRRTVEAFLNGARQYFGLATLSISATVPVVSRGDTGFAAAFVAATPDGVAAAETSRLRQTFGRIFSALRASDDELLQVNAGRLFYVSGSFDRGTEREIISEQAWCATVQLKLDPASGAPVVAAIEPLPDSGDAAGANLVLYRRRATNDWTREIVLSGMPVVDFDLDFVPGATAVDGATPVWFVAAVAGSDFDIKTHMRTVVRQRAGWINSPYEYQVMEDPTQSWDLGLWPRIVADGVGGSAVIFLTHALGRVIWRLAAIEGEVVRASVVATSSHMALTGSPLPPSTALVQVDSPVITSGLSLAHWAASGASAGPGVVWCAFGDGVLNFARIDLKSREVATAVIDVDRITGFSPTLALRRAGAAAIAYKDPWNFGGFGPDARDDLHFFSYEQGNTVPPAELPLAPPHAKTIFHLGDLPPHIPLDCGELARAATDFLPLLSSIILHRPINIVIVPPEGDDPLTMTQIAYAHPGLARQLARLRKRPTVLALTIDNSGVMEDIESIEIASFTEPIGTVPRSETFQLDRAIMTATVLSALMATGTRLSHTPPQVVVRDPGHAWDIVDPDAYAAGAVTAPQIYNLRDNGSELQFFLPPVVTVIDRARAVDDSKLPAPCGLPISDWDDTTRPFVDQFDILDLALPDIPGRLRFARLTGIHFVTLESHDPTNQQQGGVRFVLQIPTFYARVDDPDADVFSTEPSFIYVTLAPFVRDGWIHWWPRETAVRIGHIEADIVFGIVDWLGVIITFIPGLREIFAVVDVVADNVATSAANDELRPPGTGNLNNLLLQIMQHYFDLRTMTVPRPIEALWLRSRTFTSYSRLAQGILPEPPALPVIHVTPERVVAFGAALPGAAPIRRNLLLTSDGEIASLLEEVRLDPGADFILVSPPHWPAILVPGVSEIVTIEFRPAAPPGFRSGQINIRFNGGQQASVALSAQVMTPAEPSLRVRPPQVQFGVTTAGTIERHDIEVFNDGAGVLEVGRLQLITGTLPAGMLQLETAAPFSVPTGGSAIIGLRLAPPIGGPSSVQAILVLHSNDPARPRLELAVTATVAMGQLLANPGALEFPQSPVAANLPQLPPGLPPTVHRGPTRIATIYNLGAVNLTLQGSSLRPRDQAGAISPHFTLWLADGSPLAAVDRSLASGDSLAIVVEFAAEIPGDHSARLEVRAISAAQTPAVVTMHGVAV